MYIYFFAAFGLLTNIVSVISQDSPPLASYIASVMGQEMGQEASTPSYITNVIGQESSTATPGEEIDQEDSITATQPKKPSPIFKSSKFKKLGDKLNVFNDLLDKDLPPKGYPFPRIHGPKPRERVCIVGAGPAGIHMSLSLKKKGFSNVTIFEKTGRVGGKSYDVNIGIGGPYQPQGAFAFSSEYFSNLVELAEEYGVGEFERIPDFGVGGF